MIPLNTQVREKRVNNPFLDVHSIFPTIQGEGPFVGHPATFLRLAGCNLDCPACDTDYTSKRELFSPTALLSKIREHGRSSNDRNTDRRLIVITGGEPFRQSCGEFVRVALSDGYRIQFETNGTLYDPSMEPYFMSVTMVCSPKSTGIAYEMEERLQNYKYVVKAGEIDPSDGLPTSSLMAGVRPYRPRRPDLRPAIYVQPCDEQDALANKANTEAAVKSCMDFGYRLCLQTHKIVNLP